MEFDIKQAPLEIERKFLIKYPDIDVLKGQKDYRVIHIEQTYIQGEDTLKGGRVRRIKDGEEILYIFTYKERITDLTRREYEREISEREYLDALTRKLSGSITIKKDRHIFSFSDLTYELDIYPFWNDKATLEAEVDSEDVVIPIPPFLSLIYNNSRLAFNRGVIE